MVFLYEIRITINPIYLKHTTIQSEQKRICNAHYSHVIGMVVKKLRVASHLSAKECQLETGINFSMVESNKRKLSAQSICRMCGYFGITIEQFFQKVEKRMGKHCIFFPDKVPTNKNVIMHKADIQKLFIKQRFSNN